MSDVSNRIFCVAHREHKLSRKQVTQRSIYIYNSESAVESQKSAVTDPIDQVDGFKAEDVVSTCARSDAPLGMQPRRGCHEGCTGPRGRNGCHVQQPPPATVRDSAIHQGECLYHRKQRTRCVVSLVRLSWARQPSSWLAAGRCWSWLRRGSTPAIMCGIAHLPAQSPHRPRPRPSPSAAATPYSYHYSD